MKFVDHGVSAVYSTLWGVVLGAVALSTQAQTATDIERIQQQNEQILQQQEQQQSHDQQLIDRERKSTIIQQPALPPTGLPTGASDLCFDIDKIDVLGVEALKQGLIDEITSPYHGTCMGLDKINQVLQAITALYLDRGYVSTRAYLPQQDLSSGTLNIQVIEGKVESIDTSAAEKINIKTAFPGVQGEHLNLRDIEQGIEQLNRLGANRVRMELAPGNTAGMSQIKLFNQTQRPWQGNIRHDNSGSESTGEKQTRLYLSRDNLLGLNDFVSLSWQSDMEESSKGKKSESLSFRFEMPYGYWLYAFDANGFEYANRVKGQNQTFDSRGESEKQSFTASRVIHRDQTGKTEVITNITRKANKNFIEDVKLETSSRTLAVGKLQLRHRAFFPGNQSLQGSISYQKGLDLFGSPDALSSKSPHPHYTAWLGDLSYSKRFQWLKRNWSYSNSLSMQYSDDNLFGSEQLSIGSLYSVRGFKGESLSARSGAYLRHDLAVSLPLPQNKLGLSSLRPFIGLDSGTIFNESEASNNDGILHGQALGFNVGGKHLSADFTYTKALKRPENFTDDKEHFHFSLTIKR